MIFDNGYISFRTITCGLDEDGFKIDGIEKETEPIRCHWRHVGQDLRAFVQNANFEVANFEIIIPIDESLRGIEEATLTMDDEERTPLVKVKIKAIDHLRLVHKTKIYL